MEKEEGGGGGKREEEEEVPLTLSLSLVWLLSCTTWPYFDTNTLPEAESLGVYNFFRDVSFEQHPRPGQRLGNQKMRSLEPNIEVSGTKN